MSNISRIQLKNDGPVYDIDAVKLNGISADDYATKTYVDTAIGRIEYFHYEIYVNISDIVNKRTNVLYLIGPRGTGDDLYDEYVYKQETDEFIKIGETSIDLEGYVTDEELNDKLEDYTTTTNLNTLLSGKVDTVSGKGLSTEDYTTKDKTKLSGIEVGAQVNVQSDWTQIDTNADDFIKNKPTLATVATSGSYDDLNNTPDIPVEWVSGVNDSIKLSKGGSSVDSLALSSGTTYGSVSIGQGTKVHNSRGFAANNNTEVFGDSASAFGNRSIAYGDGSSAFGVNVEAKGYAEFSCGQVNASHIGGNGKSATQFSVGTGFNDTHRNAIEVLRDSRVFIKGVGTWNGETDPNDATGQDLASIVSSKQDTISAGSGILLSGNTISTDNNAILSSILGTKITAANGVKKTLQEWINTISEVTIDVEE